MEKPWTLRELPSNMNVSTYYCKINNNLVVIPLSLQLASAESVATATTSEGVSQSGTQVLRQH